MNTKTLPTIFLSHGAPTTPVEDIPARRFWAELGKAYSAVGAVLCISAHWETTQPTVSGTALPDTIHDFYGFPRVLYGLEYPAPGAPGLAGEVAQMLRGAGLECAVDDSRGLDHGAWVPLLSMFPQADVPVVQLSIQHHLDPAGHLALGRAIAGLRHENVLVVGSGGAVHPLGYAPLGPDAPTDGWAREFSEWLTDAVVKGDADNLIEYRVQAPYPERAHPRPDHYVPLLTALGAAGEGATGRTLHQSWYWGDLSMAAYEFG
jgi:4,5-DOPA dioxygenase extradiol